MCKAVASQIKADGEAVNGALVSIANALRASNPDLADKLTAAAQVLLQVTSNWQTGTAVQDIDTAANAIEAILDQIPTSLPYATFVAIAVSALDILIGNLATQTTQTANVVANAHAIQAYVETLPENKYRGLVTIRPSVFGIRHAFRNAWNKQVELEPQVGIAKL